MLDNIYDEAGYQIKVRSASTFNPKQLGQSEDKRDLSIFIKYIGAVESAFEDSAHEFPEDPYVVSCFAPGKGSVWNPLALQGFYGLEGEGTWIGSEAAINIKDPGIFRSGLKLTFVVPQQMIENCKNPVLRIYINNTLVQQFVTEQAGEQQIIIDVTGIGKEEKQYLEKAQRILKLLLKDFDRVCRKYHLRYYVICGSLLGAVRNKDLIPWDDDVDVAMPRKDFDILMRHVKEEWGPGRDIRFVNYNEMGNHAFLDYMTRIVYMKESIPVGIYRKITGKGRRDILDHMPMDIYVLDNASDNERLHRLQTNIIVGLYGLAIGHRAYFNAEEYKNRDEHTQKIVKILSSIGRFIPLTLILKCYEAVRRCFNKKDTECYFESNGFIYCIPWKFKKKWFGEGKRMLLGDLSVNVPENYRAFLKVHYNDYRKYPPMNVRKPTHSIDSSGIF